MSLYLNVNKSGRLELGKEIEVEKDLTSGQTMVSVARSIGVSIRMVKKINRDTEKYEAMEDFNYTTPL